MGNEGGVNGMVWTCLNLFLYVTLKYISLLHIAFSVQYPLCTWQCKVFSVFNLYNFIFSLYNVYNSFDFVSIPLLAISLSTIIYYLLNWITQWFYCNICFLLLSLLFIYYNYNNITNLPRLQYLLMVYYVLLFYTYSIL